MTDARTRRQLEYLGAAAVVVDLAAFSYVGYLLFENPLWGGVAGLLVGAGTYLFLPPLVQADPASGEETDAGDAGTGAIGTERTVAGLRRVAAGAALAAAGLAVLSVGFAAPDDLLLGVLVGALAAVLAYLPLSRVLGAA